MLLSIYASAGRLTSTPVLNLRMPNEKSHLLCLEYADFFSNLRVLLF